MFPADAARETAGMITKVQDWFDRGCGRCSRFDTPDCATRLWAEGVAALRLLCLDAGLDETVKWGQPCYVHAGRNVAIMGALRGDFRLSFFQPALLRDPQGLLQPAGPNSTEAGTIRFDGAAMIERLAPALRDLLAQAKAAAAAGARAPRRVAPITLPVELTAALEADPDLAAAFAALTPGRQRSHAIALASAKSSATRRARIARLRDRILAGKGATER